MVSILTRGQKRARIGWQGAVHEAFEDEGRLRLYDGRFPDPAACTWLPPLACTPVPRTIFALGLNYADHASELAFQPPQEPLVFLKGVNSLIGHKAKTRRPAGVTHMHYECELGVVIGQTARQISRDDALTVVAGYTVANDYAIRDYLENYYRPNLRVKSRDTCTPIGPWLVDREAIADPMSLALSTCVNGKTTQSGNTRDMIFDIGFLIEYLSAFMTLSPGDLILTGTPQGLADVRGGDEVVCAIEGIGELVNHIEEDEHATGFELEAGRHQHD
jgi:5-oxopent-3-ene-1,2,5-tricarboxylate decarboxylase/2-hydroxyhepta-2,4-diene-1,7-dioate isomerase